MKKIAVLRANALGDFIFILPALQALRDTFPGAEIVLLGKQWHQAFLSGRPGPVDRVVVVPPYPGVGEAEDYVPDPAVLETFFAAMAEERFDLAFQLHGGGRNSNPFVRRLGAARTVGLKTPDAEGLDLHISYVYHFNETLRYLEVVSAAGAQPRTIIPKVETRPSDLEEIMRVLDAPLSRPVAVVHPGATDIRRRWPPAKFARIADQLVAAGYFVCITGSASENEAAGELIRHASGQAQIRNLCGRLSLGGLTGLLAIAGLMVSNDTGPLHLARALNTPTVGLFWCINGITGLPMVTDLHRTHVSWHFQCPLCGLPSAEFKRVRNGCRHHTSFIGDIREEDVRGSVAELIALLKERSSDVPGAERSSLPETQAP